MIATRPNRTVAESTTAALDFALDLRPNRVPATEPRDDAVEFDLTNADCPPRVSPLVPAGSLSDGRRLGYTAADRADGCRNRFPIDPIPTMLRLKLAALRDQWQAEVTHPDPNTVVFLIPEIGRPLAQRMGRTGGIEVTVRVTGRPGGFAVAEVSARLYGAPSQKFTDSAGRALPGLVQQARTALQTRSDRRNAQRTPARLTLQVFPVESDGTIRPPVFGQSLDVSAGGVGFTTDEPLPTDYAYVVMGEGETEGDESEWAVLTELVRTEITAAGYRVGGRYAAGA